MGNAAVHALAVALAALASAACTDATVGSGPEPIDGNDTVDAGDEVDDGPDASASAGLVDVTLTQSASDVVAPLNSIGCIERNGQQEPIEHKANSYYRVFELAAAGIDEPLVVHDVAFGIEEASSPTGSQPVILRLHALTGAFVTANLVELASVELDVADQMETLLIVPIAATAPAGSALVVEVHTPDSADHGRLFFMGSNSDGQTAPSYLRAPAAGCEIPEPTDLAALSYPGVHLIMKVMGQH